MKSSFDPTELDLIFPLLGETLSARHAYPLFAAISRRAAELHDEPGLGVFQVAGTPVGDGTIRLDARSVLRLRLPANRIPLALPLSGKSLDIDGHLLRVGVPQVLPLLPAATLYSRLVLIKLQRPSRDQPPEVTPGAVLDIARRHLTQAPRIENDYNHGGMGLSVGITLTIPTHRGGERQGEPIRRVVTVKGQTHAGYALHVAGLSADDSLHLQSQGLGGRRKMGCGLFVPVRDDGGTP